MGRIRTLALLLATLGICAAGTLLATATSALALTAPVTLDSPENGDAPQVAYDPVSKTTFIAWSDNQSPDNGVELCVLPLGASGCSGGGPVLLSVSSAQNPYITGDNTISLGALTVLPGGDVVVIGTPVETGSIAWESPADGSAFLSSGQGLQNTGDYISPVSLFYTTGNAVGLSASDVGLLNDYGDTFSDSTVAGPESPPIDATTYSDDQENANQGNGGLYPRKALGTSGPEIAAESAPAPAAAGTDLVVGVGDNYAGPNTTLPGCINSSGTGYGVGFGAVNGQSNATGTLNAAGIPGYGLLACSAENPVVASPDGGTQGIGVLEDEGNGVSGAGSTYTLDYRPFYVNATGTGGSFSTTPALVAKLTEIAGDIDVVDDTTDGVYAMWDADGLHVDYSSDGGLVWGPPALIPEPTDGEIADPVITAVGDGSFQLAYDNSLGTGVEDFLQTYNYEALLPPVAATVPGTATATTTSVTLTVSCSVTPCTVTVTITIPAAGTAFRRAGATAQKTKLETLATGKLTIAKAGKHTLKLKWNPTGKRLIKANAKLRTTLSLSTLTVRGTTKSSHVLKITKRK